MEFILNIDNVNWNVYLFYVIICFWSSIYELILLATQELSLSEFVKKIWIKWGLVILLPVILLDGNLSKQLHQFISLIITTLITSQVTYMIKEKFLKNKE